MCLKIENCYLKIFVEIRVDEKMGGNAWNVVWKLKIVVWKYKPNTTSRTTVLSLNSYFYQHVDNANRRTD